jgi:hypothetical protein
MVDGEEAANQIHARYYVNSSALYVPQVFHFFNDASCGFSLGSLVIENAPAVSLQALNGFEDGHLAKRTINAIRHLALVPVPSNQGPGPVVAILPTATYGQKMYPDTPLFSRNRGFKSIQRSIV